MQKVKERRDLSREVLKVDLDSSIFANMLETLNSKIIDAIKKTYSEEFKSGDINLKITLSVPEISKEIPIKDEFGNPKVKIIEYKALNFKHNITTTYKKVDKEEDIYFGNKELEEDEEGNFIEKPVYDPQISMFQGGQNEN